MEHTRLLCYRGLSGLDVSVVPVGPLVEQSMIVYRISRALGFLKLLTVQGVEFSVPCDATTWLSLQVK